MRVLSSVVNTLLSRSSIKYFFLVSVGNTDHTTSLPYDITMSNGTTYLANNGLISIDPPRQSTTVDSEAYKISFADPNYMLRSYFESGAVGDDLRVYVGFINNTAAPMVDAGGVSVQVGEPFKDMRDAVMSYRGFVDSHGYSIEPNESRVIATIQGASPMADLDMVRTFMTSKDYIKQFSANDTSYDQIYEGSVSILTKWGKI